MPVVIFPLSHVRLGKDVSPLGGLKKKKKFYAHSRGRLVSVLSENAPWACARTGRPSFAINEAALRVA